jgi:fructose-1,6-bisphosphatase/inositol monophosphatase family enzyme
MKDNLARKAPKLVRRELTPAFLEAAKNHKKKPGSDLEALLSATEFVRQNILLPGSKDLGSIEIERKDTGEQRASDAKTLTIKTDRECEAAMEKLLTEKFPKAFLVSEEKFGAATSEEKRDILIEALKTDKQVLLTDPLDATRDFRGGGDGYGVMVSIMQKGELKAAVAHRCTDHADPAGLGHTLTFEAGDGVRRDGRLVAPLSERSFSSDPKMLRGYAGFEFIEPMRRVAGAPETGFPNLLGKFDSVSDLWTCSKMYDDLITGAHHFMLVPPPCDIFDYPAGIALIREAGGVVRFLDGKDATFEEVVKRQAFVDEEKDAKSIKNTLVFAVSEGVFAAVQKTVLENSGVKPAAKAKPETPSV